MNTKKRYLSDNFSNLLLKISVFVAAFITTVSVQAQHEVQVNLFTNEKIESTIGFLISSKGTIAKPKLALKKISDRAYLATIPLSKIELQNDTVVTAMAMLADGSIKFSEIKPAFMPALRSSYLNLASCPIKAKKRGSIRADVFYDQPLLQNLVDIRQAQRELVMLRVEQALSGAILDKLIKLEAVFGFVYSEPLSAKLPAFELLQRLSNLKQAIANYEQTK